MATKPTESRRESLELALKSINKEFGDGSAMFLGDREYDKNIPVIPTGSLVLDIATGVGGVPRGRVIEIYGPESAGKSSLCLHIVANAQKAGDVCAYVDAEHSLDPIYAEKLGADPDELIISQPSNGEQALQIVEMLLRSGGVDVVIVDSVAALVPEAEIEGDMADQQMGLQARLMSKAMRKLAGLVHETNACLIFTNQIRNKIGVFYGSNETTTGGNALKFYTSLRLDIRRTGQIKSGDDIVGATTKVKVVKNKVAPPFKTAEFSLYFGKGISLEMDVLNLGVSAGLIEKKGAWLSYKGEHIGQGLENARQYLADNTSVRDEIYTAIRKHFGLNS